MVSRKIPRPLPDPHQTPTRPPSDTPRSLPDLLDTTQTFSRHPQTLPSSGAKLSECSASRIIRLKIYCSINNPRIKRFIHKIATIKKNAFILGIDILFGSLFGQKWYRVHRGYQIVRIVVCINLIINYKSAHSLK